MLDYHVHVAAHGEYGYTQEWIELYMEQARENGIVEIGLCEHNEFVHLVDLEVFKRTQAACKPEMNIKLGLEWDFYPGLAGSLQEYIEAVDYDYIIGSVHFIDGWGFDHPDCQEGYQQRDIDEVYARYADILAELAATGRCDIVGHIDLVKIWGHRPRKPVLTYLDPVLRSIRSHGLAVEINSGGLRKPVEELYPSRDIVERMFAYDIPITLGSDAHRPEQVGAGLAEAYSCARRAGYRRCVTFNRRAMTAVSMDY